MSVDIAKLARMMNQVRRCILDLEAEIRCLRSRIVKEEEINKVLQDRIRILEETPATSVIPDAKPILDEIDKMLKSKKKNSEDNISVSSRTRSRSLPQPPRVSSLPPLPPQRKRSIRRSLSQPQNRPSWK